MTPWTDTGSVAVPGGTISYATAGEGPPVVLLHMLGGWIANWRDIVPALAAGHRVVALDLLGHGDSDGPEPEFAYSLAESSRDVLAALDQLGVGRAAFVGNSLGGCVSIQTAVETPDRVEKLVLISVAMGVARTREEVMAGEARATWFNDDGTPKPRDPAEVAKISGTHAVWIGAEQNDSRARAGRWVHYSERGVGLANLQGMLPRISQPTLLMYGERDPLMAGFEATALAMIPNVRTVHIPGAGRFPQQEQPVATAEAIQAFLSS